MGMMASTIIRNSIKGASFLELIFVSWSKFLSDSAKANLVFKKF